MMTLFLTYELKVAVLIAVFYIFWRLLVAHETWHRLNRIVLLSTAVASFVLPLCVITIHRTVLVDGAEWMIKGGYPDTGIAPSTLILPSSADAFSTGWLFNWPLLMTIVYILGVIVVLSKMLLSLWWLHRIAAESEIHPLADGRRIAVSEKAKAPFSWWKTVFLNHHDFEEGTTALLTHELGHLRLHHSADVLLVELLTALQWFNPAMWMLRADLRAIHEYEADQQVLSHGFNDIQYLQLLIRKAAGQSGYSLANGISNSALKKRINMMLQAKSPRRNSLKLLALLPIVGITLALNAETVADVVYKNDEPQKQVPVKRGKKNTTVKTGVSQTIQVVEQDKTVSTETAEQAKNVAATAVKHQEEIDKEPLSQPDVFDGKVDEMPRFPGGFAAMMQYMITNMHYPEEAKEAGVQGDVIVSFVVEKDGSISNARVKESTHPSLDEEALRLISAMPKWMPAKQNGEAVRAEYSLPIPFHKDLISEMIESTSFKDLTKRLPGAEIDENGIITINGKEVKRIVFDGTDIPLATTIGNIVLNQKDYFDYEIDGVPISVKDLEEKKSLQNPIKSVEYVQRDSEHPKDRLLITTKKAE